MQSTALRRAVALHVGAWLLVFAASCPADEYFQGRAYSRGDHVLLYSESHWIYARDGRPQHLVLYRCPDGTPFARKTLRYLNDGVDPDFELLDARSGHREGVRVHADGREVFFRDTGSDAERTAPLSEPDNAVIDAGFDEYVRSHWDELASRVDRPVAFLVPSRLRFYDFRIHFVRDEVVDGSAIRHLRLAMTSWYGFALPHIDVAYDLKTRALRSYRGISNLRSPDGGDFDVDIDFPASERRRELAPGELAQAEETSLAARCPPR